MVRPLDEYTDPDCRTLARPTAARIPLRHEATAGSSRLPPGEARNRNLLRDSYAYARRVSRGSSISGKEFLVPDITGVTEGGELLPVHPEGLATIFEVIG